MLPDEPETVQAMCETEISSNAGIDASNKYIHCTNTNTI